VKYATECLRQSVLARVVEVGYVHIEQIKDRTRSYNLEFDKTSVKNSKEQSSSGSADIGEPSWSWRMTLGAGLHLACIRG
jgi:hypothetical protein